ncbi:MAG: DUF1844 domain-containing protein [Candidatus Zixiibacteriota bacterium]|nr:MAG: DUF1844 domain-containing protein [candidate division Zixibacteria bacterium]
MNNVPEKIDLHLMQLVLSLQAGAMQQLGKVVSPFTGKVERDLTMAKHTIDILGMLETKMKGNLSEDEQKFLGHVLYELRLNYVDESKKPEPAPEQESAKEAAGKESESGPNDAPEDDGRDNSESDK